MSYKVYMFDKSIKPTKRLFYQSIPILKKNYEENVKRMYLRDLKLSERSIIQPKPLGQIHPLETYSETWFFPKTNLVNLFNDHSTSCQLTKEHNPKQTDTEPCYNEFDGNDGLNNFNIILGKQTSEEETAAAMLAYFFGSNLSQNGFKMFCEFLHSTSAQTNINVPKTFDQTCEFCLKNSNQRSSLKKFIIVPTASLLKTI